MIEETPTTILSVAALAAGTGRVWRNRHAVLVESPLTPGEPGGFGSPDGILDLLTEATDWTCVAVSDVLADALADGFAARFGLARTVVGLVHTLRDAPIASNYDGVRELAVDDLLHADAGENAWLRDETALAAAAAGRVFGVVSDGVLRGHCGAFAVGEHFADLGVCVTEPYRRRGLAAAAAAAVSTAVCAEGRTPVWGCSEDNVASRAVAAKLGFTLVDRMTYLVRA